MSVSQMKIKFRLAFPICFFISIILITVLPVSAFSQLMFTGKVIGKDDASPIPFATIGIKGKNAGTVADAKGRFRMAFPRFVKHNDTVIISSIGFISLRLPVSSATDLEEFKMQEDPMELSPVTVFSFLNKRFFVSSPGEQSFFRGWYSYKTGGEIGNIIAVPHKMYKLNKIFFKVDNKYDTCLIRLHVRKIENSLPAGELLTEDLIMPVYQRSIYDEASFFDLSELNLVLSEKMIFIGFEVIDCSHSTPPPYSLSFVGAENGQYVFKPFANSLWEKQNNFSIYFELGLEY